MEDQRQKNITERYANQPLFQEALTEFLLSVIPYLESQGAGVEEYSLLERLIVPERAISFKVVWEDDKGNLQHNIGYRLQFNSALGPYKGGLRFDPSVNEDVLKFLGFEQIFKNALTGLPLGAGKGGSDFNPKGKSDREVQRFCVAFMDELSRYIGANTDVPAGDIGVGAREIGYLYGEYKKLMNRTDGTLTGKGFGYGGSHIRPEATGYGAVYFAKEMLEHIGKDISGLRAVLSGSGNVATHAAEKLLHEGAYPLTLSDRSGYIYCDLGLSQEIIEAVKTLKEQRKELSELVLPQGVTYHKGSVWQITGAKADICIPSATQNEIDKESAEVIVEQGIFIVVEGANMPSTLKAINVFQKAGVLFGPAKAVNAGGVAVSGLEMTQNAGHLRWTRAEVDTKLNHIMKHIHETCVYYGASKSGVDYVRGANIGGFVRVFEAMKQLGW